MNKKKPTACAVGSGRPDLSQVRTRLLLLQQGHDHRGHAVALLQHRGTSLQQHLRSGHVRAFGREVGVHDAARSSLRVGADVGQVGGNVVQAVTSGAQCRTQRAQRIDRRRQFVDHGRRGACGQFCAGDAGCSAEAVEVDAGCPDRRLHRGQGGGDVQAHGFRRRSADLETEGGGKLAAIASCQRCGLVGDCSGALGAGGGCCQLVLVVLYLSEVHSVGVGDGGGTRIGRLRGAKGGQRRGGSGAGGGGGSSGGSFGQGRGGLVACACRVVQQLLAAEGGVAQDVGQFGAQRIVFRLHGGLVAAIGGAVCSLGCQVFHADQNVVRFAQCAVGGLD